MKWPHPLGFCCHLNSGILSSLQPHQNQEAWLNSRIFHQHFWSLKNRFKALSKYCDAFLISIIFIARVEGESFQSYLETEQGGRKVYVMDSVQRLLYKFLKLLFLHYKTLIGLSVLLSKDQHLIQDYIS